MFREIALLSLLALGSSAAKWDDGSEPPMVPEPRQSSVPCSVAYTFDKTNGSAILRSPGYPGDYPGNLDCKYDIKSPAGTQMTLTCNDFNVEPSANCAYDAFSMSLSGDSQFSDRTYACGRGTLVRNTTANALFIGFKTDPANPSTGGPYRYECVVAVRPVSTSAAASPAPAPATAPATAPASGTSNATCSCGFRNENTRIVGGSNAGVSEFPWRVALISPKMGAFCGGTIISPSWVLTAAHCTNALPAGTELYVNVGDHDMSTTSEATNKVIKVDKIVQNANYNSKTQDRDTALLHLATPLTFGRTVQPVCLPWSMKGQTFQGKTVTASGWGTTSYQGSASSVLNKVDLPVLTTSECTKYYPNMITDNMVCTYSPGKDTCQGDSGGSIDMKSDGRYYAIGVVSWGVGCAGKDKPGVYAKVTNFLDWIESKTAGDTFCKA